MVGSGGFGIQGTGVLIVTGLITGGYLLWRMRGRIERVTSSARSVSTGARVPLFALAIVIGVMMSRSWTVNVFQAFTPTWYKQLGYGPGFYGPLATTLVLASAVGTAGCGTLADRYGRRAVTLRTVGLNVAAILPLPALPGPLCIPGAIRSASTAAA